MPKFRITFWFEAETYKEIEADSEEQALRLAKKSADEFEFLAEPDKILDVSLTASKLVPVTRLGQKIWVDKILSLDRPGH